MANPSPPLPPPAPQSSILLLFLLLITTAATSTTVTTTTYQEHESMLETLRTHGHTLFTNAITTSDLQYQLLTTAAAEGNTDPTAPFTLFAPKDTLLFSLDMNSDATAYVDTLRYHVIPYYRHTFSDLQNLSSPFLDTLLPNYSVLIGKTREGDVSFDNATVSVIVDGVRVSHPDLFIGSRIAVHGIDGILVTGLNMNRYFDSNDNETGTGIFGSPAPTVSGPDGNIEADRTLTPMSEFDWNNNIPPVSPASPSEYWNIPAEEILAPLSQFNWNINSIPPVSPVSSFDGNIPVAPPPKILQDQAEKLKKRGKRRQSGRGHRRHKGTPGHRRDDL